MRFKAAATSNLVTVTFYFLSADEPGYGAGTGGTWRLQLFAVDGSGFPTGVALASQSVAASAVSDPDKQVTFSTPYSVTSGTRYALVFENTDASPNANFFSTDHWYTYLASGRFSATQRVPAFPDLDLGHGYHADPSGPWFERAGYLPILDIEYASGAHQGMSYAEASYATG